MTVICAVTSIAILLVTAVDTPNEQFDRNMYLSQIILGMAVVFAVSYLVLLFKGR